MLLRALLKGRHEKQSIYCCDRLLQCRHQFLHYHTALLKFQKLLQIIVCFTLKVAVYAKSDCLLLIQKICFFTKRILFNKNLFIYFVVHIKK